jgi:hypothetical protein
VEIRFLTSLIDSSIRRLDGMSEIDTNSQTPSSADLAPKERLELFKFYEEAAEKTKAHAWTQTSWILTLNAGVLGFSLTLYLEKANDPLFIYIELLSAGVGVVLCVFLFYVLNELGRHIRNYWTTSNKLAAPYPPLASFIGESEVLKAREPKYEAEFPAFCRRLQYLAVLFLFAHVGWAGFVIFR